MKQMSDAMRIIISGSGLHGTQKENGNWRPCSQIARSRSPPGKIPAGRQISSRPADTT